MFKIDDPFNTLGHAAAQLSCEKLLGLLQPLRKGGVWGVRGVPRPLVHVLTKPSSAPGSSLLTAQAASASAKLRRAASAFCRAASETSGDEYT